MSPLFLFVWLPLAIAAFAVTCRLRPGAAPLVLLATSALFVVVNGALSLGFLAASIIGNYAAAKGIGRAAPKSTARRLMLGAAIIINLAPLAFYKANSHSLSAIDGAPRGIPLGLAFYSLQQITYLVHRTRSGARDLSFVRYAAWGSFFAQLPAGPIGAYGRMAPQYERMGLDRPVAADIARGLTLALAGVVKKTWIADPLARTVDAIVAGGGAFTPLEAWAGAIGYMLQLYFDFSAYSDIAIGIGLCFGLRLPINFDSPLKSTSPGQYVMRWHVSLMTFVRDYVFEPTFRAARRLPIRSTARRYSIAWAMATVAAYLAVAAWHTLAPVTLAEGLVVALALIALQFARQARRSSPQAGPSAASVIWRLGGQALLLATVAVFALLLRIGSTGHLATVLSALMDVGGAGRLVAQGLAHLGGVVGIAPSVPAPRVFPDAAVGARGALGLIAAAMLVAVIAPNTMQIFGIAGTSRPSTTPHWRPSAAWGWGAGVLLLLVVIGLTGAGPTHGFIYAQF